MNQRLLISIIILAGIGSIGSVMAFSGTISAGQGNFNNVLITGSCTGCGTEATFSNYNTIFINTTSTTADNTISKIQVDNNGAVLVVGSINNRFISSTGATVFNEPAYATSSDYDQIAQSTTGLYKAIINDTSNGSIQIYKSNSFLQTLGINISQFSLGTLHHSQVGVGISPNGKFIAVVGEDVGGADDRIIVFQGS